ncbi:hypothetical protein GOP47_0003349 [Adiantum capillus-veneris]|uniref:Uncharacterized protein n=1 Tax=Adiantum capillus-veneris TaxID=13818 RepID=A0A9D4ZRR7_ADICA|nr:hypothetical protein GOP47_0003349 [Adiantum capillus-veneris]
MHDIRWLSKGQVMVRLVRIMPALLTVLQNEEHELYLLLTNYKIQFLMHFFADVLGELNILSCKLQEQHPDTSSIGNHLKSVVEVLRASFLGGGMFGIDTKHTSSFIKMVYEQNGALCFKDLSGSTHYHGLHLGPMWEGDDINPQEIVSQVISKLVLMCSSYVSSLITSLWSRFKVDFSFFEATKYFSPKDYCGFVEVEGCISCVA